MAALLGRRVRTAQPQQAPLIDWSNPITAGLVFVYSMGNEAMGWGEDGRSVVQYQRSDGTVNGVPVNTNSGTAVRTLTGSNVAYSANLAQSSAKAGSYSLFAFATGSAAGTQSLLDDDDGVARRFQLRMNANKAEYIPFYSGGNGSVVAATAVNAYDIANGFAVGTSANGSSYAVYQKGIKAAATLGGVALAPNQSISVGARKTNVQQYTNGGIQLVAMWNRPLTDAEHQSLADNPWQLFKAAPRRMWLAYSASAVTTNITPGAGALALAGYAPTVAQSANRAASPAAGALTLTGYAPSITQSATTSITPGAAALTLTGFAPTVAQSASMTVSPTAGAIAFTGYAPTVTRTASQQVQPGAGGLTLTGYAPLITQGVDNAPRVNVATIMRITTTNRTASLGPTVNVSAPIRSTGANAATIMDAAGVNCTAALGPASINRTVGFS